MTMITTVVSQEAKPSEVELLILGAGWTSTFLIPLLEEQKIKFAATTTNGRDGTYKFKFEGDESHKDLEQYQSLPAAKTLLITFPLKGKHQSSYLVNYYTKAHKNVDVNVIQLGSSGIFTIPGQDSWVTRKSKYDTSNARAEAEDELISMGGSVLNLSGLWGGARHPKNWIDRVATTKEQLASKTSLHLIHGLDVARSIIAVHQNFAKAKGQRWVLTDTMVYDWWSLILGFVGELDRENKNNQKESSHLKWVGELMNEQDIKALPRSMEQLGRCYDVREFWTTFGLMPIKGRVA